MLAMEVGSLSFQVEENWNQNALGRERHFLLELQLAYAPWLLLFIYLWSRSHMESMGPLKKEHCCHPPFPVRCHSCDKEGFIIAQFGAFIIYSL